MAGLLDFLSTDEGRLGLGLLAAAGPRADGMNAGGRIQLAMQGVDARKQEAMKSKLLEMQMANYASEIEARKAAATKEAALQAARKNFFATNSPETLALSNGQGPTMANAETLGSMNPMAFKAAEVGLLPFDKFMEMSKPKEPKYTTLGDRLIRTDGANPTVAFTAPAKPEPDPPSVKEYKFAVGQGYKGSFEQFQTALKQAGATNIGMPKIDIKMGDSVAGQIGPMAKDSKNQTQGAVQMFDAADRIEKALASNKVLAGPGASTVQTVKQFIQMVGGGNDDAIRQTGQVIKSLAQMSVQARKQLQGQGQVTESEAAAVAKAEAGDINSLTTGELADLVTLTKRAAHYSAKSHQELIDNMNSNNGTRGAASFYRVPGMESLLKHEPKLPQIGGKGDVRSRADEILKGGK